MLNQAAPVTGIFPDLPGDDYRRLPGVSITRLKNIGRSPLHYKHMLEHPRDTAAFTLGRLAHMAVLEPARFERDVVVWGERTDSGSLRPRRGKDWDAFVATYAGREIVTEDEHIAACAIRNAVFAHRRAPKYLRGAQTEVSMRWALDGVACKGRLDALTMIDREPVIVGLKTARDCSKRRFGMEAARFGYFAQWSFYADGFAAIKSAHAKLVEIVVESQPPHDVAVYMIPAEVIDLGRDEYTRWMEKLAECERTQSWPGAVPDETPVELPAWAWPSDDISELELEGFEDDETT